MRSGFDEVGPVRFRADKAGAARFERHVLVEDFHPAAVGSLAIVLDDVVVLGWWSDIADVAAAIKDFAERAEAYETDDAGQLAPSDGVAHHYWSNACRHGVHHRCPLSCDHCAEACLCRCHEWMRP